MPGFVHLHVHSHYSLLDGLPKIPELVAAAKKRGFSAIALTDHNNVYGAIEFYEACKKHGLKPIIGCELQVTNDDLADKTIQTWTSYHLVVLAENYTGYKNILRLVSRAQTEGLRASPLVSKPMLAEHHEGLIALSGCLEGEISWLLRREQNPAKAERAARDYEKIFGSNNFFLELCDLPALSGQIEVNSALAQISKATGIGAVVTRDAHYLDPEDAEAQDILTCIALGRTLDEPSRPSMAGIDYSLGSAADITSRFKHFPEAIQNTAAIAERVNIQLELNKWHFPAIDIPEGKNADQFLREEVYQRLPAFTEITAEVRVRVEYELSVIIGKGYSPYFLVVADYVRYARQNGIIETTRGSGAGSIVSYALGITSVNPLFFKLPFERFLNPFRPSPPDIDADFADDRRDEMIAYVTKKYGADKVAQIITFGTMLARAAVRDAGRALGLGYGFCDQVAKLIPFGAQGFHVTIDKALSLEPDLKNLSEKNPQVQRLLNLAKKIEGSARHTSIHAAGVVIAPTALTDFTPIQCETGGSRIVTQYEMHAVESAGLLKMDFLGIRNLSILGHAVEIVEKTAGQKIDIHNLYPWADKKTYDMLSRGETVGVFQLSGSGMTRYLKELKPSSIFDIMAMVALFRPGPMESIPEYIRRKHHPELIEYLDPRMKDYLDQSLGLIVYQDDVLLTAINLAGYNWEEADKFRKAMGKKIPAEMEKQKEKFFKGCKEHGNISELKIHRLWELIEPFAAYGFNKAHAASYGVVAYQTAYLKANFPLQYMTAVLIAESGDVDKVPSIIHECERMGIQVLPPDINESFRNFAMVPGPASRQAGSAERPAHIRFGLNGIKNLGEHIAEVLYRERKERGPYASLEDLLSRVRDRDLNKKSLESLIKCGALDSFGFDRGLMLANAEGMLNFMRDVQSQSDTKQHSLFAGSSIDLARSLRLAPAPPATADEKITWEKELLGVYVTAHPFSKFEEGLAGILTPLADLGGKSRHEWVVVGGVIDSLKKKITRSGQPMLFVTIQDTSGSLELLVFPRTYEATKEVWAEGRPVCVVGKTSDTEGDDKLFVEKAHQVTAANLAELKNQLRAGSASIREYVPASAVNEPGIELPLTVEQMKTRAAELKALFAQYPGAEALYLVGGGKKIKTQFRITASDELLKKIGEILGIAAVFNRPR